MKQRFRKLAIIICERGSLKLIRVRRRIKEKKRKKNESNQLHKEYEDFDKAEKDLEDQIKINEYCTSIVIFTFVQALRNATAKLTLT